MPWCPKCRTEFREGFLTCCDCGSDLVDSLDDDFDDCNAVAKRELSIGEAEEAFSNGMAAYEEDEFDEAITYFTEVVRADPEHLDAFNMLGLTFAALELPREAWRSFKHAIRLKENDSNTHFYIADFLCDQGDYELAKEFAERYFKLEHDEEEGAEMSKILEEINGHIRAGDRGSFVGDLSFDLETLASTCPECKVRLPLDAPYCPVCGAAHIYLDDLSDYEYDDESEDDWEEDYAEIDVAENGKAMDDE